MNSSPSANTVLIIEDDLLLSQMYAAKFRHHGFTTIVSRDGEDLLALIAQYHPSIILLDILLPKYTGLGLLKLLHRSQIPDRIPVIALTNHSHPIHAQKALELGAKEYLIKAMYSPEAIVQKVQTYLSSPAS